MIGTLFKIKNKPTILKNRELILLQLCSGINIYFCYQSKPRNNIPDSFLNIHYINKILSLIIKKQYCKFSNKNNL